MSYVLFLRKISQKWAKFSLGSTYFRQNFKECVPNQYTWSGISECQMWLQVIERSLILLRFLMSEVLYLHQIFTYCVSNQYTHFVMLNFNLFSCRTNFHSVNGIWLDLLAPWFRNIRYLTWDFLGLVANDRYKDSLESFFSIFS